MNHKFNQCDLAKTSLKHISYHSMIIPLKPWNSSPQYGETNTLKSVSLLTGGGMSSIVD